jgi:hypothetical protein
MARNIVMATLTSLGAVAFVTSCAADPRTGYDRVRAGDSQAAVMGAMGKPSQVNWRYQWNELSVSFADGIATSVGMVAWDGNQRLPVVSGMTPAQVEAIVGLPEEVCNYYDYIPPKRAEVCFSKGGAVVSKVVFDPPEPPPPLPLP